MIIYRAQKYPREGYVAGGNHVGTSQPPSFLSNGMVTQGITKIVETYGLGKVRKKQTVSLTPGDECSQLSSRPGWDRPPVKLLKTSLWDGSVGKSFSGRTRYA